MLSSSLNTEESSQNSRMYFFEAKLTEIKPKIDQNPDVMTRKIIVKDHQHVYFAEDIKQIRGSTGYTGKISTLSPFYDEDDQILRVGGR